MRRRDRNEDDCVNKERQSMWREGHALAWPSYVGFGVATFQVSLLSPSLPIFARDGGAPPYLVGLIVSANALAGATFSIPAAPFISCYGVYATVVLGSLLMVAGNALSYFFPSPSTLFPMRLVTGLGWILVTLSSTILVKKRVSDDCRGRVMGTIGGVARVANVVSPLLGGFIASSSYGARTLFLVAAAICVVFVVIVQWMKRLGAWDECAGKEQSKSGGGDVRRGEEMTTITTIKKCWHAARWPIFSASIAAFFLMVMRGAKDILIPLIADDHGFSAYSIGLVVAIGNVCDMCSFPAAGMLMDSRGRKIAGGLSMVVMSIGMVFLYCQSSSSFSALTFTAGVIGCGNGISSGLVLATGTDLAPKDGITSFLSIWRCFAQIGLFLSPVCVGIITTYFNTRISVIVFITLGFFGAIWFLAIVPETKNFGSVYVLLASNEVSDSEENVELLSKEGEDSD